MSRRRRPVLWCGGLLLLLLLLLVVGGVLVARHVEPMLRSRLLRTFRERFDSPSSLEGLHVRYSGGGFQVDGHDLRVQSVLYGVPGDPQRPMLRVGEFHFHVSLLAAISDSPRIHHVRIRGVELELPPETARNRNAPDPKHEVDLEYAEVADAHIRFAGSAADRAPLLFDFPLLQFRGVSRSRPIRFHAVVDNGPPLRITETDGTIGPWNFDDPRRTPLQGNFVFHDKDVSSVPGLHGRLNLDGRYQGTVGSMHAEGTTTDPAFALDVSSHSVAMRTKFAMTLGASENSIAIERLEGAFGQTAFVCSGEAIKNRDPEGFRLDLQLRTTTARVEDALVLATRSAPPVVRGALSLTGRLQMRAGAESVSRKLQLSHASFQVNGASFSNPRVQLTANELAERAQGNPENAAAGVAAPTTATIRGKVLLRDAVLRFPAVEVVAPGSASTLHGSYSLRGTQFVFDGTVHTEAKLSHMTTGVKSILLKPFNRMLGHNRGSDGATLPLHIDGVNGVFHVNTRVAGISLKAPGTH